MNRNPPGLVYEVRMACEVTTTADQKIILQPGNVSIVGHIFGDLIRSHEFHWEVDVAPGETARLIVAEALVRK